MQRRIHIPARYDNDRVLQRRNLAGEHCGQGGRAAGLGDQLVRFPSEANCGFDLGVADRSRPGLALPEDIQSQLRDVESSGSRHRASAVGWARPERLRLAQGTWPCRPTRPAQRRRFPPPARPARFRRRGRRRRTERQFAAVHVRAARPAPALRSLGRRRSRGRRSLAPPSPRSLGRFGPLSPRDSRLDGRRI